MTELVARVVLRADSRSLVTEADHGTAAVDRLGDAATRAGADAKALGAGAENAAAGVRETGTAATGAAGAVAALGAAGRQAGAAAQGLATDQRQAAAATANLGGQQQQGSAHAASLAAANAQLAREMESARADAAQLTTELRQLQEINASLAGRVDVLESRLKGANREHRDGAVSSERHAFGIRNLGQQFGDLGLSIAGGISPARAFGQQAGQIGYAMSELGGKAGKVGAFLTGPWGIALTVAAAVAAPFVEELFKAGDAADAAKVGADGLSEAQSVLGAVFDLTTGKLKKQNEMLLLNARLTAINLRGEASKLRQSSAQAFEGAGRQSIADKLTGAAQGSGQGLGGMLVGALAGTDTGSQNARNLRSVVTGLQSGKITSAAALRASEKIDFSGLKINREQFQQALIDAATAPVKDRIADQIDKSLTDGVLAPELRRDKPAGKPKKPASTAARDEFGRDAGDRIAAITGQFDRTPSALQKTNVEIAKLDDLIDDLGRRKPPGFEGLIASAEAAKTVVRRGLIETVAESFDRPRTLADQAAKSYRQLDAIAADLEQRRPPDLGPLLASVEQARGAIAEGLNRPLRELVESQEQSLAVGRLIAAGRADEAEALRVINQLQREMGPLTERQKAAVLATTQALAAQDRQIERNRQRQQLYIDALSQMRDIVRAATQDFARGDLGQFLKAPGRMLDTFLSLKADDLFDRLFEDAFRDLRDQVKGTSVVEDASARMADAVDAVSGQTRQTTHALGDLADAASGAAGAMRGTGAGLPAATPDGGADIVVTGRRDRLKPESLVASGIERLATKLGQQIGIDKDKAGQIGKWIGEKSSTALAGAATGTVVAGLANSLGLKMSGGGAQIGGAIGNFLPIPGGSIIGAIAGGLLGGLFKKAKYGTATISSDGTATSVGSSGNNGAAKGTATGLAGQVQQGIAQIAQQLGGVLGKYTVSIGTYDGKYRVSTSGQTGEMSFGKKNRANWATLKNFGDDQAGAIAFAIADAIADGAIAGISPAVAQALRSSSDINAALAEALKVADLEKLLGGVTGQLQSIFKTFDTTAAERVRLAKAYGLDLLAVEKLNAEQRADLLDQTLKGRIGSLKELLSNLTYGDLFEGSPVDRRAAIRREMEEAKADAEAGVAGAADRYAALARQLIETSKEAFGTAGPEYAADRAEARAEIERIIQLETQRVNAAAGVDQATADAVVAGNALTQQIVAQQGETNALLGALVDLAAAPRGGAVFADLALTTRGAA
ncbi:hypothetical protein [Sphingomonas melonis]|uniref:hypothetical protein n=1 Tax=Sphingomonas melonis TaxID=152682 RepID=UPI00036FA606|nr:hypothetical protein [Sphingomonas melonis]